MKILSRKTISTTAAILCSFFVCISLHAIHVKYIKGTLGPLKFEHCSPANGAASYKSGEKAPAEAFKEILIKLGKWPEEEHRE